MKLRERKNSFLDERRSKIKLGFVRDVSAKPMGASKVAGKKQLALLRRAVDRADRELIKVFGLRFRLVKEIGHLKEKMNEPVFQKSRWSSMMNDRIRRGNSAKLAEKFVRSVFELIHSESMRIQRKRAK